MTEEKLNDLSRTALASTNTLRICEQNRRDTLSTVLTDSHAYCSWSTAELRSRLYEIRNGYLQSTQISSPQAPQLHLHLNSWLRPWLRDADDVKSKSTEKKITLKANSLLLSLRPLIAATAAAAAEARSNKNKLALVISFRGQQLISHVRASINCLCDGKGLRASCMKVT